MNQSAKRALIDPMWETIRGQLETIKRAVTTELRNYPQPIAGCDVQIPVLWEARDGIALELTRLEEARSKAGSPDHQIAAIQAFIDTSPYIDASAAAEIGATLEKVPTAARSSAE